MYMYIIIVCYANKAAQNAHAKTKIKNTEDKIHNTLKYAV